MSHFSLVKVKIKNPNETLLKKVVEQIAKDLNGQIVTEIVDFNGNVRTDFLIGVKTPAIHRGIGIALNKDGEVEIIGDFWRVRNEVNQFQEMLVQGYAKEAMKLALQARGYAVQEAKQGDKVLLRAVEVMI